MSPVRNGARPGERQSVKKNNIVQAIIIMVKCEEKANGARLSNAINKWQLLVQDDNSSSWHLNNNNNNANVAIFIPCAICRCANNVNETCMRNFECKTWSCYFHSISSATFAVSLDWVTCPLTLWIETVISEQLSVLDNTRQFLREHLKSLIIYHFSRMLFSHG